MHLLGIDVGTTGCKAIVFDPQGTIKGQGFHEYDVVCHEPSMAEQDAERVWELTCGVIKQAVFQSGVKDIAALSVSVQGDAVIPVDREFRALHPAILGMDYRSLEQTQACEQQCGAWALFQRTGMRPHPLNTLTKVLFLREKQPRIFGKTWKMVTYADYVLGKLGGEPLIDHTMASRTMAFSLSEKQWSSEILAPLGLEASLFSTAVPSGARAGNIRPELAAELGLPTGLLLVTGAHDQCCAAIGAGIVKEHIGVVSTGTAEVLATALQAPALSRQMFEGFYPCYLHAKEGMFFTFALNHVGGILLKWFRDNFCQAELVEAAQKQCDPYLLIDAKMPVGPSRVMVLPHFNGSGTPWCDLESKGAVLGLTLATSRHEIAKAILEGLTFELLINLDTLQQCGIQVRQLVAVGGGAKSKVWLQMKADILQRPIQILRCRESACLGAALLAGTAAGLYASLDEAVAQTVVYDREYLPEDQAAVKYAEKFATYRKLYPTLRPLNQEL
jgi:xylulokinase